MAKESPTEPESRWRGADHEVRLGLELVLPIAIGGLPGVALYYALVRHRD